MAIEIEIEIDTFLEYKTVIKRFNSEFSNDHDIHLGLYLDHDGYEQFGIIIVDKRGIKHKKYISSFSSKFCPEENKEWFLQVLGNQMWHLIKDARNSVINEVIELKNRWLELIGE